MKRENSPIIETSRLQLKPFTLEDVPALFEIHRSEKMNKYLPWWPVTTLEEATVFSKSVMCQFTKKSMGIMNPI